MRKQQLIAFIDQVIAQGESIQRNAPEGRPSEALSTFWYPRIMSVFHVLGSRADPWKSAVAKCPTDRSTGTTNKLLGVLKAIREAVDQGLLAEIEDTAHTEAFTALLDQAQELADNGLCVAAGSVGQTVLLEHLREYCVRTACLPDGSPSVDELAAALYLRGHLTKPDVESIGELAAVGSHCQHNNQPPIPAADVRAALVGVGQFIAAHPLP